MYTRLYYKKIFENSKIIKLKKHSKLRLLNIFYKRKYVGYTEIYKDPYELNSIELHYFYIEEKYRQQGIGTLFMNILCEFADKNNYKLVLLPHKIDTTPKYILIKFYKKFGFKINESEMFRKPKNTGSIVHQVKNTNKTRYNTLTKSMRQS